MLEAHYGRMFKFPDRLLAFEVSNNVDHFVAGSRDAGAFIDVVLVDGLVMPCAEEEVSVCTLCSLSGQC